MGTKRRQAIEADGPDLLSGRLGDDVFGGRFVATKARMSREDGAGQNGSSCHDRLSGSETSHLRVIVRSMWCMTRRLPLGLIRNGYMTEQTVPSKESDLQICVLHYVVYGLEPMP